MSWVRVILAELLHHRSNAIAGLAAVMLAVGAIFTTGVLLSDYETDSSRAFRAKQAKLETQLADLRADISRAMGHLGFNMTILPAGQDTADWYAQDQSSPTMAETSVRRLAEADGTGLCRVAGQLRRRIDWPERNWPIVVIGRGPVMSADPNTASETGQKSRPDAILRNPNLLPDRYAKPIEPGTVALGHELHKVFSLHTGDDIQLMGRTMRVARCLPQEGNRDDLAIWTTLADAQQLLAMPDHITEIVAQGTAAALEDLPQLRRQVSQILPGAQVVQRLPGTVASKLATTNTHRSEQARMQQELSTQADLNRFRRRLAGVVGTLVVASCALWIGWLAWSNVTERRVEIGIWRACGLRARRVAAIFLGRWLILGIAGAAAGLTAAALILLLIGGVYVGQPGLLALALAVALLLSATAAAIASLAASRTDPAITLRTR
jgi:putative ABC transport system permease protein